MALPFDAAAQRKKYILVHWIRAWNEAHPADHISYAEGFDPSTDVIGPGARETLKKVQRIENWPHIDGQFDRDMLRFLLPHNIRGDVMASAHSQLGQHEWPPSSNLGEIVKYLKSCGLGGGYPWCAAFVTWNLKQNGFKRFPPNPAYVPSWHSWALEKQLLKPVDQSRLGDIWVWWRDQHVGFCDDTNPDDLIAYGLDGNVGAYGGSVTQVRRTSHEVTACIDLEKLYRLK